MKVALTVWEKRISPLFDCAGMLLVLEIVDCTESDRYFVPFNYESPFSRAAFSRLYWLRLSASMITCASTDCKVASMVEWVEGVLNDVLQFTDIAWITPLPHAISDHRGMARGPAWRESLLLTP